jgi:GT2 family glycosyltransferase
LDVIDFLQLPILPHSSIRRTVSGFAHEQPWSVANFGKLELSAGWWHLEAVSTMPSCFAEVRLRSAGNPLIAISTSVASRIYLPEAELFEAALQLSPWPGNSHFEVLRLRKLTITECLGVVASNANRLRSRDSLAKLTHLVLQLIRRRPVGLRLGSSGLVDVRSAADLVLSASATETKRVLIGQFPAFLESEDVLDNRALDIISAEFARSPEVLAIYSDVSEGGVILPRPTRDVELARWFEIARAPLFFRKDVGVTTEALEDWLAQALMIGGDSAVKRVPLPLVRRTARNVPSLPNVPVPRLDSFPRVSIVIPTKYRMDLLARCLDGLATRTGYSDIQVIVVDNGSKDQQLPQIIAQAKRSLDVVKIVDDGEFNFSRLINFGVRHSSGEVLLLMNDDVEPMEVGWLDRMVSSAIRPEVGAVGARLLYPDRTIQHAGVSMGIGGICGHLWKGVTELEAAHLPYVALPQQRLAVTGACLAVRREAFDNIGGFDEAAFPVALNDIDFCLRLRKIGLRNIYRGDAVLTHHESQSRGHDSVSTRSRRRAAMEREIFLSRWRHMIDEDPFGSPEFDLRSEAGVVRYDALYGANKLMD